MFEEELAGLGFQLKERPWFEDRAGSSTNSATTSGSPATWPILRPGRVKAIRFGPCVGPSPRSNASGCARLGRTLTLAVEATCRNFVRGETEADIAGHLAAPSAPRRGRSGRHARGWGRPARSLPPTDVQGGRHRPTRHDHRHGAAASDSARPFRGPSRSARPTRNSPHATRSARHDRRDLHLFLA